MTELYIDKQLVVLPRSLNVSIIEENPFYTKNGKYTLDIVLSLEEDANAKIYMHVNRLNTVDRLALKRSALLIVDNEVVLNGTEIITEVSDNSVTIQLVSGNSELNFFIGGDKKVRDLDLGKAIINPNTIKDDLKYPYPKRNWLILPFIARNFDDYYIKNVPFVFNRWAYDSSMPENKLYYLFDGTVDFKLTPELKYYKNYRPQPYLCFIIESVLKAIGYKLINNSLANNYVLKYLYITHGFDTLEFAKMLPDWTVSEFLEKIEIQFDCTFVINEYSKEAGLYFNYEDVINNKVTIKLLDEFTIEIDEDATKPIQTANIGYNIDVSEDDYYMYQKLDKYLKKGVKEQKYSSMNQLFNLILNQADIYRFRKIYIQNSVTSENIIAPDNFIGYENKNNKNIYPKKVDSFKDLIKDINKEELDYTFDILPAPMQASSINGLFCQYPVVLEADPIIKKKEDLQEDFTSIQDLINEDNKIEPEHLPNKLYLAIYSGRKLLPDQGGSLIKAEPFPISYVESLCEFFVNLSTMYYFNGENVNPFRLEWLYENIYSKSTNIDTSKTYKLSLVDFGKENIISEFIINNKSFRCVKIERTITIDGFDEIVRGEFYPYNNDNK